MAMLGRCESAFGPALATVDNIQQRVLSSFPLCDVRTEDLSKNPLFCKLLAALSHHVDHTGLTLTISTEKDKAERDLQTQRLGWQQLESFYRLLQEMVQDHFVQRHHTSSSPDRENRYDTVRKSLLVSLCMQQLDPSVTTNQDPPLFLGLTVRHVEGLMPTEPAMCHVKQQLLTEVEEQIKKKCFFILSYYQPGVDDEPEVLRNLKLSRLPENLEKECKRAEALREKTRENTALLHHQLHCYLTELMGCIQIMQLLLMEYRLKTQKKFDTKKVEYLEAKCQIIVLKIRAEMLQLQLDTYTLEKIPAQCQIRKKLDAELMSTHTDKQSTESTLLSFELLGQDFEALVEEYSQLRQEIDNKSWALKEFSQYSQ